MTTKDALMLSGNNRLPRRRTAPASELKLEVASEAAARSANSALLMLRVLLRTLNRSQGERLGK
jgi:hypothetical protein